MKVIRVKHLSPTDTKGSRYKISMEGMKSAIVACCCYHRSAYDCLKKFVKINELDWPIDSMAYGIDKEGVIFCFPQSIDDFAIYFKD